MIVSDSSRPHDDEENMTVSVSGTPQHNDDDDNDNDDGLDSSGPQHDDYYSNICFRFGLTTT